jgi:ligand-binding sensor domain-containing protein
MRRRGILLPLGLLLPALSLAQQLPIRSYTVADGLAEDRVNRIVADSRGYVWIATSGGLSRFDGYRMKTYGVEDGLPYRTVNTLLETPSGAYLVGASTCRAKTRLIAAAVTSSRIPSSLSQLSKDDPMFFSS